MTSIDLDQLARVTGGVGCGAQPQPQQDADPGAQSAPQSGGFLGGIDQVLSLLQGDGFQQIIGGVRSMLGSFAGQPQQPDQQQA